MRKLRATFLVVSILRVFTDGAVPVRANAAAPTVAIINPSEGSIFGAGVTATITAAASASAGRSVSKVEFFAGPLKLGESDFDPYILLIPSLPAGRYVLTAKVTDSQGASTTSIPVNITVGGPPETLILFTFTDNTVWSYNREGKDLGTQWRDLNFSDSQWEKGEQPIGNNSDQTEIIPIRTAISRNNNAGQHITTLYVRGHFNFPGNSKAGVILTLRNMVDDGAVFYLNGVEVSRFSISAGTITYDTFGTNHEASEFGGPVTIPSAALRPGDNVFAVEVHQADVTSSDIVFGAELIATLPVEPLPVEPPRMSPPTLQAGNIILTWSGNGTLQSADQVTGPWTDVASATSPFTSARTEAVMFFRVKQ